MANTPSNNSIADAGKTQRQKDFCCATARFMVSNVVVFFAEAAEPPPVAMPATLPPPSPCKDVVFYEPKEYSPGLQLYWASCACSLPDMAEALAHGAEVNWVNTEDDKRTPLIMAVHGVSAS